MDILRFEILDFGLPTNFPPRHKPINDITLLKFYEKSIKLEIPEGVR